MNSTLLCESLLFIASYSYTNIDRFKSEKKEHFQTKQTCMKYAISLYIFFIKNSVEITNYY